MTSKKDREAEEFLAGAGKKKGPKPKQNAAPKAVKAKGFVLSMDVMQDLGGLGVSLPTSEENVKNTVEQLKEKLSYFKENQERVTQEVLAGCWDNAHDRTSRKQGKTTKNTNEKQWQPSTRKKKPTYPENAILTTAALRVARVTLLPARGKGRTRSSRRRIK